MAERGAYEVNNERAHVAAYVLIGGLAIEFIAALIFHKDPWETGVALLAIALIVGGVWGEVHFGRLAREAGDKQLAEYEARTAEANARAEEAGKAAALARLELAKFRAPRSIDDKLFLERLKDVPKVPVGIWWYPQEDAEACSFAMQVSSWLASTKWQSPLPQPMPPYPGINPPALPTVMQYGAQPYGITVMERLRPDASGEASPTCAAIWEAFRVSMESMPARVQDPTIPEGIVRIVVAPKG